MGGRSCFITSGAFGDTLDYSIVLELGKVALRTGRHCNTNNRTAKLSKDGLRTAKIWKDNMRTGRHCQTNDRTAKFINDNMKTENHKKKKPSIELPNSAKATQELVDKTI